MSDLSAAVERMHGFVTIDPEGRYTHVTPRAALLLDKAAADPTRGEIWANLERPGRPLLAAALRAAIETQQADVVEVRFTPKGPWYAAHLFPSSDGVTIVFEEVTERRRARRKREAERSRLDSALGRSRVGILDWDLGSNKLVLVEPDAASSELAAPSEPAPARQWLDRIHPEDRARLTELVKSEPSEPFELDFRLENGQDRPWRWLHLAAGVERDPDGKPTRLAGVYRDVDERMRRTLDAERTRDGLRELALRSDRNRENERARLAREVQSRVVATLTEIGEDLTWYREHLDAPNGQRIDRLQATRQKLNETIAQVRELANELRPAVLEELGLGAAIRWLCKEVEQQGKLGCVVDLGPVLPPLDPAASTLVFLLLQECLDNVVRHANAKAVWVRLQITPEHLILSVQDDGQGIEPDAEPGGIGILTMRERVAAWGGSLNVGERTGGGTSVVAALPIGKVRAPPKRRAEPSTAS